MFYTRESFKLVLKVKSCLNFKASHFNTPKLPHILTYFKRSCVNFVQVSKYASKE